MKLDKKLLYVSIFSITWSLLIFFNKLSLNHGINPITWSLQTTLISATLLSIYILFTQKPEFNKLDLHILTRLTFIGFFVGTGYIAGIYGLKLSTSINYGFIIKSSLVFTIILAFTFLKEKINRNKIQIMMMFILGAYLITSGGKIIIPKSGDLLTLLAAFCFSSALIIQKPLTKKISPDIIGWGRIFFALPILFVSVIAFRVDASQIVSPTYMIIVGMLGPILAISINKTISVSSASYLTMMSMITPVLVIILSLLFLKEPVSIPQIIGGLIIVVSGVLVHKSKI